MEDQMPYLPAAADTPALAEERLAFEACARVRFPTIPGDERIEYAWWGWAARSGAAKK